MTPELQKKIEELGYTLIDTDDIGTVHYSKQTSVGAPSDKEGDKIFVFLSVQENGRCGIAIDAFNPHGHIVIQYDDLDSDYFRRSLKSLERAVVYAWREVAD